VNGFWERRSANCGSPWTLPKACGLEIHDRIVWNLR
jgi:hypothetical protein